MNKYFKNIYTALFLTLILIISSLPIDLRASGSDLLISNVQIGDLQTGFVNVKWQSSEMAYSHVIFGEEANNMPFYVGGSSQSTSHSADLTGLQKNKTYYFKIIAYSSGKTAETFVYNINTKDMPLADQYFEIKLDNKEIIHNAAILFFTSTVPVRLELRYGLTEDNLNRTLRQSSLKTEHYLVLNNLEMDSEYYFHLTAQEEGKNTREYSDSFKTLNHDGFAEIKISNLKPETKGELPLMPERAIISFTSNLSSSADIQYGLDVNRLNYRQNISAKPGKKDHQIILEKLQPNTIYYYRLNLKSDLNRASLSSPIYSFQTAPLSNDYLNLHYHDSDIIIYKNRYYLLFKNKKFPILDRAKFNANQEIAKDINLEYFNFYPEAESYWGEFFDGQVVKEANKNAVYLINGEYKQAIANWQVFTYLNYQAKDIITVNRSQLNKYKNGNLITHSHDITSSDPLFVRLNNRVVKSANNPTVYFVSGQKKYPFLSEEAFRAMGFNFSEVLIESESNLSRLIESKPIF